MKTTLFRWFALAFASIASALGAVDSAPLTAKELSQGYREHRILAKPKREFRESADRIETREGLRLRRKFARAGDLRVLELDSADSADRAIARLRATGRYEYVEPDIIHYARVTPNDPSFAEQWSLRNTEIAGADIDAVNAWNLQSAAANVIVAVVDSGVRLTHQDIAANLWMNTSGKHGINALVPTSSSSYTNPNDDSGHGTHVAGIIGAVGNNGVGISGVAWSVKLMPLKFINASGSGSATDAIECIEYAIANGAHIINASYGSFAHSQGEYDIIKAARDAGIIFVAAAGNDAASNDVAVDYPSGYALDNIVSVASTTRTDALAASSNTGSGSVELAAPGDQIYSTYFDSNSSYKVLSGTSMAAPHVSGALALLKARFPADSHRQLINRLLRSTTKIPSLAGKVQTGGRLNLSQALSSTSNRPFNDDFSARPVLAGSMIRVRSSNVGATAQSGEPFHAGFAGTTSLWWSWTAAESTEVGFDTIGSGYDTVLAIYTGSSLDSLQPFAANDDASGTASRLLVNVTAGTTYHVAVSGKNSASGFTALKIGAVPAHDNFAAAKTLTGLNLREASTTLNASRQTGEPDPTGKAAGHSVWYKWTAPATGRFSLAAFATTNDTIVAVYTGSSVTNLTTIAFNDNNANSTNTDALAPFDATAGTTYYFQIDHTTSSSSLDGGDFVLTLTDSLWEFPTHDIVTSSPAVAADGTVYVGSNDGHVYAINPNGTRKWQFPASSSASVGEFDGPSPAIGADGTVYISNNAGSLYAINAANGSQKWVYATGSASFSAPAVALDGTIYHRNETKLVAVTSGGTLKWSFTLNTEAAGGTYCSPVIAVDGTIYVGTSGGKFYALTDNGTGVSTKWSYTADGDVYTSPAIAADGTVYFGTLDGAFYALTPGASSAAVKWSIKLPKFESLDTSISSSPALGTDGTIYFAAYDHKLYALDPATGATKWAYLLGDEVRASSPAVAADGTVYIGVYDGLLYAVNADGTLQRTFPSALLIRSSPALAGGRLYFGSNDAKLHAFDIGQSAAASPWPMYHANALNNGRAPVFLSIIGQPASLAVNAGASATLTTTATGISPPTYQWQVNGTNVPDATAATLTLPNLAPASTGLYTTVVSGDTTLVTEPAIVGLLSGTKTLGTATEIKSEIVHPNGKIFDQVLLTGAAAAITADHSPDPAANQVTRISFIDLDDDIVQVELSGPGTLSLVLEGVTPPAVPIHYNQPDVTYVKGHAGIVIAGADERTNVSVFSVGRATAFDPTNTFDFLKPIGADNLPANNQSPLFEGHGSTNYDGIADLAFIAILSTNGKFGGVRTANANYFSDQGLTGVYAPGVAFSGPVYIGDLTAFGDATPVIVLGSCADTLVTGGDLTQDNNRPVEVSGITQLVFVDGTTSHGNLISAQSNQARLTQDGVDVTSQLIVNPPPH